MFFLYEGSELYYYYYTKINKRALAIWFRTRVEWLGFNIRSKSLSDL